VATVTPTAPALPVLTGRAVAYELLAKMLGSDPAALVDAALLADLRAALAQSGDDRALDRLPVVVDEAVDLDALRRRWVRWFDQGRVAPYECSHTPASAGGHTPRLADIAGFYRAFGVRVVGDRPDHVVAELEFLSVTSIGEAAARATDRQEPASVCADATRSFLRDHAGRWLDAWAARVGAVDELAPWAPFAAAAAELVARDALDRNVVPVRTYAVLPDDAGLMPEEDTLPECGGDAFDDI